MQEGRPVGRLQRGRSPPRLRRGRLPHQGLGRRVEGLPPDRPRASQGGFRRRLPPRRVAHGPGGRDRLVRLWDAATGEELVRLPGHADYVYSLAFSPDGKTLVSSSGDTTLRLWDTEPLRKRS